MSSIYTGEEPVPTGSTPESPAPPADWPPADWTAAATLQRAHDAVGFLATAGTTAAELSPPADLGELMAFNPGLVIKKGDHILIDYDGSSTPYKVADIAPYPGPRDLRGARLTLIPPTEDPT